MAHSKSIVTATSLESIKHCRFIIVQQNLKTFCERESFTIYEVLDKLPRGWKHIKSGFGKTNIVLVKTDLSNSINISFHDLFILSSYYSDTTSIGEASAIDVNECDCFTTFSMIKHILNSKSTEQWVCFWLCHNKSYFSIAEEKKSIPVEDFIQLESYAQQIIKLNEDGRRKLNARIPLGETENGMKSITTSHVINQEDFFRDINELVYEKRKILKKFNTLAWKHFPSLEDISVKKTEDTSGKKTEDTKKDNASLDFDTTTVPLVTQLQFIVAQLNSSNWEDLRVYVGRDIPITSLENIPNGIEFFNELETREMISMGNTEYIKDAFFSISRVDLVHILDCFKEGDYSLLTDVAERRNNQENRNKPEETRQSVIRQINEMVVTDGGDMTEQHNTRDRPLQRTYRNVPQSTTPSTAYPVQEHIEGVGTQQQITDDNERNTSGRNIENTTSQGTNDEGLTSQSTRSESANAQSENGEGSVSGVETASVRNPEGASAVSRSENVGERREWVGGIEHSCEHYERFCKVKFGCCDGFWGCHRCHNAKSNCSTRKLRSRDIKKVKCCRCGKIQDFPKDSPHCAECNLKFSEYFCPICQHLTGKQNDPFHCEKCGICR